MSAITATGATTVITTGFVAYGESDQSEGRGGTYEIGSFTTVEEAIAAARGKGTQGDPGYVSSFEWLLHEGGAVTRATVRLIDRRRTPEGYYLVGWLDLREYADGRGQATCPVCGVTQFPTFFKTCRTPGCGGTVPEPTRAVGED
ncbi:hypothetical protein [Nocardioides sp. Leaf285]|uniref:hypothetical protein n=1 Tax=Nocardioides sp. Leaf285 TaxID=1736322 RepID=UPI000702588D|nr:hypothetical protein [Nocardioides sp. Leaf285]KQP62849.1 hypothetical protein ASF47_17710 [Nocardioides sp. Leaf285]